MAAAATFSFSRPQFGSLRLHLPEDPIAAEQRFQRQQATGKFPAMYNTYDILSFQEKNEAFFRRFADAGERRSDAPRRSDTPVVDPVSGFTSVGADAEDGNYKQMEPLVVKDHRPQSAVPYGRPIVSPIPELRDQNAPWVGKNKELEKITRCPSQFPGPKETKDLTQKLSLASELSRNKEWRDAVATRAFYTSETQKLYSGVDWSAIIPQSASPPPTTVELQPDMVSFRFTSKRYAPKAEMWQQMGSRPHSWDFVQSRNGHHVRGPMDFCSPSKTTRHIPGYSGHSSGYGERDHPKKPFTPLSIVHSQKPRYSETSRRGNIPGYTGCVLFSAHHPTHSQERDPKASTTSRVHRELKVPTKVQLSPFRHKGPMSKMVTLTSPYNPFNKV